MSSAITIDFDFSYYIPGNPISNKTIQLSEGQCIPSPFIVSVKCGNLVPSNKYQITYSLLNPNTNPGNPVNVFNPSVQTIYASYETQIFATVADLNVQGQYILQATIQDITNGPTGGVSSSDMVNLRCGVPAVTPTPTPSVTPSAFYKQNNLNILLLDSDMINDSVIDLSNCSNDSALVALASGSIIGNKYSYTFYDYPANSVLIENRQGEFFAGSTIQNFNSKIALTGTPYAFIVAEVTDINTNIKKQSQPILLKCFQTDPCSSVLPVGININFGAPTFKTCTSRGITTASISSIRGGSGFAIRDKLSPVGGGGYGAEIDILSGGITVDTFTSFSGGTGFDIGDYISVTGGGGSGGLIKITSGGISSQSINSLSSCGGFQVGDLITTVGGGGSDALISVSSTGLNGTITSFAMINSGYGYTYAPNGIRLVSSQDVCTSAVFNPHNFTIPAAGGISNESINLLGGTGYNIGEILGVVGGEGSGGRLKIISGSLSTASMTISGGTGYVVGDLLTTTGGNGTGVVIRVTSVSGGAITGWEIVNGGYGFTGAPTGLVKINGSGSGATISGNANNFAITPAGQITSSSISGLIGSGPFSLNDIVLVSGGGGSGAAIQVTGVNGSGNILEYVVLTAGSGYDSIPTLTNATGTALTTQPVLDTKKFTTAGYVIISAGCCYKNAPTSLTSEGGDGSGATVQYVPANFIEPSFVVINSGAGYTSAPTGISILTGDGSGSTTSFNANNFTIPCSGGITYSSISNLIGKSFFGVGQQLVLSGGGGSGGKIEITEVSTGSITKFVILDAGCGYTTAPTVTSLDGGAVIAGISFNTSLFTQLAVAVTNPGYGYFDQPTSVEVKTGYGILNTLNVNFNSNNFIEISGPPPTPSNTPTNTPTPTPTLPALCNDLQSAGGQNQRYDVRVNAPAPSGQNFLIVENSPAASISSILQGEGLINGTTVTNAEDYFVGFNNNTNLRKIYLNNNLTDVIPAETIITGFTTDTRIIKTAYWPANMRFDYDAYDIPDRFKVIGIPMDTTKPEVLLLDTNYRGNILATCGFAVPTAIGKGTASIYKPEGITNVKVIVEAPCIGTAWEYILYCPVRVLMSVTPTVTPTISVTPSVTPTISVTPSVTPTKTVTPTITPSRSN
jgi:hypothetical protein